MGLKNQKIVLQRDPIGYTVEFEGDAGVFSHAGLDMLSAKLAVQIARDMHLACTNNPLIVVDDLDNVSALLQG